MKFSIITVCYNAEKFIQETIESVLWQTNRDYEYIIKDGCSTDSSRDILDKYRNINNIRIITQEDGGIYNAMNQAVELATGDYIFFINCGDTLYDENVLEDVAKEIDFSQPDILYGNIVLINRKTGEEKGKVDYLKEKRLNKLKLMMGYTVCHQAVFAKRELFNEKKFDETYRYWADQEWIFYQLKRHVAVDAFSRTISYYDCEGVSSDKDNIQSVRHESDRMVRKYEPVIGTAVIIVKNIVRKLRKDV